MARREIIVDDLTGLELDEEVESTKVNVDGTDYNIDLGSASKERFVKWLKGDGRLIDVSKSVGPDKTNKAGAGQMKKADTYGYEFADVKAWAIATGQKAANGNPVTESTTRIGQGIYNAYREAQKAS